MLFSPIPPHLDPWATTDHDPSSHAGAHRHSAVMVLLADDATTDERRHAEYYLADADAFIATPNPHSQSLGPR